MRTWTGRLVREDVRAGNWMLETDEGIRLVLAGDVPPDLANRRVTVDGTLGETVGIGVMCDRSVNVASVKRAA